MITKVKARQLRSLIESAATTLTDEDALSGIELFPQWESGRAYKVDDRIRYNDTLYRVVQAHTSQADWVPENTPALFVEVALPGEIPVWKQPTGAHDTYQEGDEVYYPDKDGQVYRSTVNNNSWAPDVYGWEVKVG